MNGNSDYIDFTGQDVYIRFNFPVTIIKDEGTLKYSPGQIISDGNYINIIRKKIPLSNFQLIGNVIEFNEFNTTLESKMKNKEVALQFLLEEEEEEEKQSENSESKKKSRHWKPNNWKTVKIAKRVKSMKRYRIKKRLENFKTLNRLKN